MDERHAMGRRAVLRGVAGTAAVGAGATAGVGTAVAQAFDGWFDDVENYDGVVDRTGESAVTVEVGVDNGGGPYGYGPAAVRVDPGTEITFEWVSNTHNIVPESIPADATWEGVSDIHDEGHSASQTFETEGVYTYYCEPHQNLGMKGAVVVGDAEVGGDGGHGGGGGDLDLPNSLLTLGGFVVLGLLSPIVFGLFLRRRARQGQL